jgi:hypothetical protein
MKSVSAGEPSGGALAHNWQARATGPKKDARKSGTLKSGLLDSGSGALLLPCNKLLLRGIEQDVTEFLGE